MSHAYLRALRAVHTSHNIRIFRGEQAEPIVIQQASPDQRAYIHPIVAPDGAGILTENSPDHHPWQHGIYVGLNDVNGVGFWTEGLTHNEKDGSFHPSPLAEPVVEGHRASWFVESQWRDPQGKPMLTEKQQWELQDDGHTYIMDLTWTLRAHIPLTFGQHAYGGLFLRMPYRADQGGTSINSEGRKGADANGMRARWASCSMAIEGRTDEAGIAFLDHPRNPEHPVPWRFDGQLGISPSRCIAGAWTLPPEASSINRYRIVVFCGKTDPVYLDQAWQSFASTSHEGGNE